MKDKKGVLCKESNEQSHVCHGRWNDKILYFVRHDNGKSQK